MAEKIAMVHNPILAVHHLFLNWSAKYRILTTTFYVKYRNKNSKNM